VSKRTPEDIRDPWAAADLGPYLRGEVRRPTPTVGIRRADGLPMLYPGKDHSIIGEMESGKSWVALASSAAELLAGNHVDYVHFEESDPSDSVERLLALDVPAKIIERRFHFIGPESKLTLSGVGQWLDPAPTLAIYDGLNEGLAAQGLEINSPDGIAKFRHWFARPFRRVGAAVLVCDHPVKDRERHHLLSSGTGHKDNGLSGALVVLENVAPFGRDMCGRSSVYVRKDRPGHLRAHGTPLPKDARKVFMGTFVVDDRCDGPDFRCGFYPPKPEDVAQQAREYASLADDVVRVLSEAPDKCAGSLTLLSALLRRAGVEHGNDALPPVLADLEVAGVVGRFDGKRNAIGYRLLNPPADLSAPTSPPIGGGRGPERST
jgi:hypothetical protein